MQQATDWQAHAAQSQLAALQRQVRGPARTRLSRPSPFAPFAFRALHRPRFAPFFRCGSTTRRTNLSRPSPFAPFPTRLFRALFQVRLDDEKNELGEPLTIPMSEGEVRNTYDHWNHVQASAS